MPYARTSAGYPQELQQIAERCAMGEILQVDCETEKAARGLRARWYQYIAACKRDANNPPPWTDKIASIEKVKRVMATEVALEGKSLIFSSRDALRSIPALKNIQSIGQGEVTPPTKAEEDSIAKLMTKLGAKTMPE
jgi:hypothetical protein